MRRLCAIATLLIPMIASAFDLQAHRGGRGLAPENTLAAFANALAIGVTTLELDTGVTRDGVVVIHHDRRLNPDIARGPDGLWVAAPAPLIHELRFEELQRYDVGRLRPGSKSAQQFPEQQAADGARIPRLADLFDLVKKSGHPAVRFNIETKLSPQAPEETLPPLEFARALGLKVVPWTVNEPAAIERMHELGVDGMISDYPDRVRTTMARRGLQLPPGGR